MKKDMSGLVTGLAFAGIIGASIYMMNHNHHKSMINKKAMKKNMNKAVRNVSSFMDDVTSMMH